MTAHRAALLDWLACAYGGREQRVAFAAPGRRRPARARRVARYRRTARLRRHLPPGYREPDAPTAPAEIAVAAALDRSVGNALVVYAAGFEAMGRLSRARLYDGGWHPTAVCGAAAAAHVAARLLSSTTSGRRRRSRLALLQAGGLRVVFGSDGESLQVGMAAAAGVQAARIAAGGASITADVIGGGPASPPPSATNRTTTGRAAIDENWIKPWPCCLMSHSAIEAASIAREALGSPGRIDVTVHPVARRRRRLRRRDRRAAGEVLDPLPRRACRSPRRAGAGELRTGRSGRGRARARAGAPHDRRRPARGRGGAGTRR